MGQINPKGRIYKAFKSVLDGIGYQGNTLPVVRYPGKNIGNFYIQLGEITTVEEGCKDLFGHECTIDIQIICNYDGNYGTPLDAETISNTVTALLKATTTSVIPIDEFNMVYIVLDSGINDGGLFPTNRNYRVINNYRFYIEEKIPDGVWILEDGTWNDSGVWIDTALWNDGI